MKFFAAIFMMSWSLVLQAQNIYTSPYSIYGVGIVNSRLSTLNRGMGGAGIALRDNFNLNGLNPAAYGAISSPLSSVFEMGCYIQRDTYRTNELSESKTTGSLTNLSYWFKIKPRWSSVIGLSPFSSVSYAVSAPRSLGGITDVTYSYKGSGTISEVFWGNGFNITKNLSVGFDIGYLFGSVSKTESIEINNQPDALTYENKIFGTKFSVDAGLQYAFFMKKDRVFVLGMIADGGVKFSANQKNYLYTGSEDTLSTTVGKPINYRVPPGVGLGLSLHSKRSIVASDLRFKDWSAVQSQDSELRYGDTWNFSLGYVYKGNPEADRYLGAISLRTGLHIQNYYVRPKGHNLPWWGVSAGISIPMFDNRSSINITYSFDQLGTIKNDLILQRSQQIMIDVVIRDLWAVRRKYD